jgi:hypothetical protein
MPEVAALVDRVRESDSPVGLELQWDLVELDDGIVNWLLELHVIVAVPGLQHSGYSTIFIDALPAEQLAEREAAVALATRVAQAVGLPLHAPAIEGRGGQGGSAWLRARLVGPPVPYDVDWQASWWTDDARRIEASGSERIEATSGERALDVVQTRLLTRFVDRPLDVRTTVCGETRARSMAADAETDVDELRARALTSRPAQLATLLSAASPRALVLAFSTAFYYGIDAMRVLARWRAGELDDAALDAELAPKLDATRPSWDRPRRLREADANGRSIAALLRDERTGSRDTVRAMRDLMDVFGVSLAQAKQIVSDCSRPESDAESDRIVREMSVSAARATPCSRSPR